MALLTAPERLSALERSGILKRKPDDRLVTLCMTAVTLIGTTASHLNVITEDEQVHVASYPPAAAEPRIIPAADSGCPAVVVAEHTISIPDARADPDVCTASWVELGGIQAYLGVPVRFEGEVLGSFCTVKHQPYTWTPWDITVMDSLADMVERLLVL